MSHERGKGLLRAVDRHIHHTGLRGYPPHYCRVGGVPDSSDVSAYASYIQALPATDCPELFGLHANADVTFQLQESTRMVTSILALQPRVATSAGGRSSDDQARDRAREILAALPAGPLASEQASVLRDPFAPLPCGAPNSLAVVLRQEVGRYDQLLGAVRRSLSELLDALRGAVVMSAELEAVYRCLLDNQVPAAWSKAYPSLKPLSSWTRDLLQRLAHLAAWLTEGQPRCFWLPGLTFPQGFTTAVLQNHARKTHTPIDRLSLAFLVLPGGCRGPQDVGPELVPEDGVLVHGLFLEGASWDEKAGCLAPAVPGQLHCQLPVVHFLPVADRSAPEGLYACPLYKTQARAGVLSTTGHSTNFVLHMALPIAQGSRAEDWVLQGTAALCSLSG